MCAYIIQLMVAILPNMNNCWSRDRYYWAKRSSPIQYLSGLQLFLKLDEMSIINIVLLLHFGIHLIRMKGKFKKIYIVKSSNMKSVLIQT